MTTNSWIRARDYESGCMSGVRIPPANRERFGGKKTIMNYDQVNGSKAMEHP